MRNPFRKKSPEEKFTESFLRGMKQTMGNNEEAKVIYVLIKSSYDSGDYVEAQKLINNVTSVIGKDLREKSKEKTRKIIENLNRNKYTQSTE